MNNLRAHNLRVSEVRRVKITAFQHDRIISAIGVFNVVVENGVIALAHFDPATGAGTEEKIAVNKIMVSRPQRKNARGSSNRIVSEGVARAFHRNDFGIAVAINK